MLFLIDTINITHTVYINHMIQTYGFPILNEHVYSAEVLQILRATLFIFDLLKCHGLYPTDCYSKRPLYFIPAINGWNAEVGSRETKFPHLLTPKG